MPKQAKEDKTRLTLSIPTAVRERLEELQSATGAESMTEVIRRALAVYEVLIDARVLGEKVVVKTKKGERELLLV